MPTSHLPPRYLLGPPSHGTPSVFRGLYGILQRRVPPELRDELNRWYGEEHIPLLTKVPAWRMSW